MIFVKPDDESGEYIIQNHALIGLKVEENTVNIERFLFPALIRIR